MPEIDRKRVQELLADANSDDKAVKGRALEQLVVHLFEAIPGVTCEDTDVLDAPGAHEIDVFLRNNRDRSGLPHLPHLLIVESKNWGHPVGSPEISRFGHKIGARGETFGIFVTKDGITGAGKAGPMSAYSELLLELDRGRAIIVFRERELVGVRSGKRLAELVMNKWMELKMRRDLYWASDEELERPELLTGIREAIRAFRRDAAKQFLAAMPPTSDQAEAVAYARELAQRLEQAVEVAKDDDQDPFWSKPRVVLVEFGGAVANLVLLNENARGGDAEWLEIAADLNGPDRVNAFVGGKLWRILVAFYLDQVEGAGDLDSHLASLSLVQIAIEQVGQIDSIEPDFEDD